MAEEASRVSLWAASRKEWSVSRSHRCSPSGRCRRKPVALHLHPVHLPDSGRDRVIKKEGPDGTAHSRSVKSEALGDCGNVFAMLYFLLFVGAGRQSLFSLVLACEAVRFVDRELERPKVKLVKLVDRGAVQDNAV